MVPASGDIEFEWQSLTYGYVETTELLDPTSLYFPDPVLKKHARQFVVAKIPSLLILDAAIVCNYYGLLSCSHYF